MVEESLPGPVDFVMIEFPADASTTSTAEAMADLVDTGIVRLYDIALIRKAADGRSDRVDLATGQEGSAGGFAGFAGAQSGLFDDDDIMLAGEALEPNMAALLIAYENAWASPFVTAAHQAGGEVVASQRIPAQELIDVLEALESAT